MRVAESRLGRGLRWEVPRDKEAPTEKNATPKDNLPSVVVEEAQTPPIGQSAPPEDDSVQKWPEGGPEDKTPAEAPTQ